MGIDSGIVLTSGRAKTVGAQLGVDGNGIAAASTVDADNGWNLPGDPDLANAIGQPVTELEDACILEFDFVPLETVSGSTTFLVRKNTLLLLFVISMMHLPFLFPGRALWV
ncbi:MAG: choice-of-anchor L domain-containing protein [Chitinophagaceae bacterium]|nr:choice-of-anchor L domain-containing protein [Chitinophagaceae bacterium]